MRDADSSDARASIAPLVAACLVATFAFWAYTQTLLPGVDLGDTGGFQASVLWPEPSARRAYPLYFALAKRQPFVVAWFLDTFEFAALKAEATVSGTTAQGATSSVLPLLNVNVGWSF